MPNLLKNGSKERDYLDVFHHVTKVVSSATSLDEIVNFVLTSMTDTLDGRGSHNPTAR